MWDKIYLQEVHGFYRKIKNRTSVILLFIYFAASWLRWPRLGTATNQAIMIDLPNRKAYLFAIEIGPEEAYYITGMLIIAAMSLFFITTLFGRLWCGYTCVHTVFVDIFRKVEQYFQGDRNSQMVLDKLPMNKNKFHKKLYTHLAWLLISFSFAFGWVCYFYDAPSLASDVVTLQVTPSALKWLIGLTVSTYLLAGFMREKVCMHMCPYGKFQSIMLNNDSSIVTYHDYRGEPRGKVSEMHGDCIDCHKCVSVCPMGIDIRNGLQMECINCGLCIDACDSVMHTLGRPPRLISYDSVNSSSAKQADTIYKKPLPPRILFFFVIIVTVISIIFDTLLNKPSFSINISRDSGTLATLLPDGSMRNTYALHLTNKAGIPKQFILTLQSPEPAQFMIQGYNDFSSQLTVLLAPESSLETRMFIKINECKEDLELQFTVQSSVDAYKINKKLTFVAR